MRKEKLKMSDKGLKNTAITMRIDILYIFSTYFQIKENFY